MALGELNYAPGGPVKVVDTGPDFRDMNIHVSQRTIVADRKGTLWSIDPANGEVTRARISTQ